MDWLKRLRAMSGSKRATTSSQHPLPSNVRQYPDGTYYFYDGPHSIARVPPPTSYNSNTDTCAPSDSASDCGGSGGSD